MTEQEFIQAQKLGQIEQVQPSQSPSADLSPEVAALQAQMRDYIPLLERLRLSEAQAVAASSFSLFDQFVDLVHWNSVDGFTVDSNGGGGAVAYDSYVNITAPGGAGIYTFIHGKVHYYLLEAAKLLTVEWLVSNITDISDCVAYLYMAEDTATLPPTTDNHFGFRISGAVIEGSVADDTTETLSGNVGVSVPSGAQRLRLKAVLNPGTDCKFYVNGVLKATLTTNLPTASHLRLMCGVKTTNSEAKSLLLGRVLITKAY